tara:strand:- start:54 stop:395 length:342 start_codon:yes stop_codon:yes gene_type:complete
MVNKMNLINMTDTAQKEVVRLLSKEVNGQRLGLRLGIKGGGCSGLSYILEFSSREEEDTVLTYPQFEVYLDRKSTIYLGGITLDHQSGLEGKGFIFQNPHASNTCGCGESFSL